MALVPSDKDAGLKTPIWAKYKDIVNNAEQREVSCILLFQPIPILRHYGFSRLQLRRWKGLHFTTVPRLPLLW